MKIGSPKESKDQEFRIGLTPKSVASLIRDGHEVWIEKDAGLGIGANDSAYTDLGAHIAQDISELFERSDLIIKVKEPNRAERALLKPRHTLFTYLHLASDPEQTQDLIASGATCIAYETVTDADGRLPLLTPMSEIAGRLAVQEAASHLGKHRGGMGILLGGATGVEPGHVVIIGGGVVGSNACRIALGLGAKVTILDRSETQLDRLRAKFPDTVNCVLATPESIQTYVTIADLLVGAVLIPGGKASKLITAAMVKTMKPGAVIADVAIDQGGCCETSRPTTHTTPTYVVDGITHYCVTNIPGAVAKTASMALNIATLRFILALANRGTRAALEADAHLRNGLNVCRGQVTSKEVAQDLGLPYTDPMAVIASL